MRITLSEAKKESNIKEILNIISQLIHKNVFELSDATEEDLKKYCRIRSFEIFEESLKKSFEDMKLIYEDYDIKNIPYLIIRNKEKILLILLKDLKGENCASALAARYNQFARKHGELSYMYMENYSYKNSPNYVCLQQLCAVNEKYREYVKMIQTMIFSLD